MMCSGYSIEADRSYGGSVNFRRVFTVSLHRETMIKILTPGVHAKPKKYTVCERKGEEIYHRRNKSII